jgi:hypothetical protein
VIPVRLPKGKGRRGEGNVPLFRSPGSEQKLRNLKGREEKEGLGGNEGTLIRQKIIRQKK